MRNKGKTCSVVNCGDDAFCKGYCSKHYQQMKFKGEIKTVEHLVLSNYCKNLGCGKTVFAKGLCQTCYTRSRRHEV